MKYGMKDVETYFVKQKLLNKKSFGGGKRIIKMPSPFKYNWKSIHGMWLASLTSIICGIVLRGCYLEKKENYQELWRVRADHERRIIELESENHTEGMILCTGGFTDKNSVTWDWQCPGQTTCHIEDCCYVPRHCEECSSSVSLEEPPNEEKCK